MTATRSSPSSRLARLCLVEDDEIVGESLSARFRLEGFEVQWCRDGSSARAAFQQQRPGVVLSDIRLPDCNGGDLLLELLQQGKTPPPFVFMTGFGSIDRAVELLKAGAADYVTKPFDVDELVLKVRALAEGYAAADSPADVDALGSSGAMRRIAESLPRLARHAHSLLISGESGVGKEYVATLFHQHAFPGGSSPFIAVNCAAIPEQLLEAELFGFERGAFTGAHKTKRGQIELADGGTLFLDEIGEMPLQMQAKLLRVLQERSLQRLGGEGRIEVAFRLVCATHRDLAAMAEDGRFREDLFYRVNVIHIRIPPLRERPQDIRRLVRQFIDAFNRGHPEERRRIDPRTEQALLSYPWPGNIRELKHAVERACILSNGPLLGAEAFFGDGLDAGCDEESVTTRLADYLMACERDFVRSVLDRHGWHMTRAAEALGITRKSLWDKCRRLGIRDARGSE